MRDTQSSPLLREVVTLAKALTPDQQRMLADIGAARWFGSLQVWTSQDGADHQCAEVLLTWGLVVAEGMGYRLTHQGELVVGVLLQQAVVGGGAA
jgi:hypothetical protein